MKRFVSVLLALVVFLSFTAFAAVPDPIIYAKVSPADTTVKEAPVYQLPGEHREIIATLKKDASINITFEGSTWHKIKSTSGNVTGWMRASDIKITSRGYSAVNFGCTLTSAAYVSSSDGFAVLRWGPATYYDAIDNLPNGRYVWKYETTGNWTRVLLEDGRIGYISSSLLKKATKLETWPAGLFGYTQVSGNTAAVHEKSNLSSKVTTYLYTGNIVEILGEKNYLYNIYIPSTGKTGWVSYSLISPESLNRTVDTTPLFYDNPYVYTPELIRNISPDTPVKVLASDGYVSRIAYENGEGYVFDYNLAY